MIEMLRLEPICNSVIGLYSYKIKNGYWEQESMNDNSGKDKVLDCLIAGGGYVGLSVAVAIKAAAPHMNIVIVDAAPEKAIENETRASAIAAAACRMLNEFGIWEDMLKDAQPINKMIITDSKTSDVVRPVFLTFGRDASDDAVQEQSEPFAHMLPNKTMIKALRAKAHELGVEMLHQETVESFTKGPATTSIQLGSGKTLEAKLLIAADGVRSRLRDAAGIKTVHWSYDQMGIVITVAHERPHKGHCRGAFPSCRAICHSSAQG